MLDFTEVKAQVEHGLRSIGRRILRDLPTGKDTGPDERLAYALLSGRDAAFALQEQLDKLVVGQKAPGTVAVQQRVLSALLTLLDRCHTSVEPFPGYIPPPPPPSDKVPVLWLNGQPLALNSHWVDVTAPRRVLATDDEHALSLNDTLLLV